MVQTTNVTDPTTGQARRFSDEPEWDYSIDFRQPLPDLKLLWGALYEDADETQTFRLAELRSLGWQDPHLDFFVETTAIQGLVTRFTVADVLLPYEVRERSSTRRIARIRPVFTSVETRLARGGYGTRSYAIRVSGRF